MPNFKILETLASGSTSKVKRGVDQNNKKIAVKIISKSMKSEKDVEKEIRIHRGIIHPNILKFLDFSQDGSNFYISLQLASHELIDLIELKIGINHKLAHMYTIQLMNAVEHLHSKGISHRDIKIDNILIDENGNLLLSDFGFATLFKYKNKERILKSTVGSYEYMAPEVLTGRYRGDSVDMWSCGMVILIMCTGVFPWSEPSDSDEKFETYHQLKYHNYSPFNQLPFKILKLIKGLVNIDTVKRFRIENVHNDEWFREKSDIMGSNGLCANKGEISRHLNSNNANIIFSQPNALRKNFNSNFVLSQPQLSENLLSLKRIYIFNEIGPIMKRIKKILLENVVPFDIMNNVIIFSAIDQNRNNINGEIHVKEIDNVTCITFNRTNGSSLEFKKFSTMISDDLKESFQN